MLAKNPENRFATTTRMVEALRRGLDTGEIMEDEVARRRESIPPPSVSRVMAKMGFTTPQDPPAPGSADPIRSPRSAPDPKATVRGLPPAPAPQDSTKPDSIELLRKRTGTPQLGVPAVAAAVAGAPHQSPRAGTIDPPASEPAPPILARTPSQPAAPRVTQARTKRPTAEPGISQVWYADGDRASDDIEHGNPERARNLISPSVTDLGYYDEAPPRRRWGLVLGALGAMVVIGGVAFALTRGDTSRITASTQPPPSADPIASPVVTADAALSTVIGAEPPDAAAVAVVTPDAATTVASTTKPSPTNQVRSTGGGNRRPPAGLDAFVPPGSEPIRRTPGDPVRTTPTPTPTPTPVVIPPANDTGSGSGGISGTPLDPYGGGTDTPPASDGAPVEKKAEFYSNLGTQQLGAGDTTSAASSFKKALEIEPNNVAATIGMGEIALRQGLFGDALAHLKKAARLAPRSSRVFTLLGEAYLNSGQSKDAATNFKKALQLDPDNTRARDGYNEASSRVPPPSDEP
jgi:hypothetical protein